MTRGKDLEARIRLCLCNGNSKEELKWQKRKQTDPEIVSKLFFSEPPVEFGWKLIALNSVSCIKTKNQTKTRTSVLYVWKNPKFSTVVK